MFFLVFVLQAEVSWPLQHEAVVHSSWISCDAITPFKATSQNQLSTTQSFKPTLLNFLVCFVQNLTSGWSTCNFHLKNPHCSSFWTQAWYEMTWLQVVLRDVYIGYLENFCQGKGCQVLEELPRELVESPFLEVFESHVGVTLRYRVWWWTWQCRVNGWTWWS